MKRAVAWKYAGGARRAALLLAAWLAVVGCSRDGGLPSEVPDLGGGTAACREGLRFPLPAYATEGWRLLATGDVDRDGRADLITDAPSGVSVLLAKAEGGFAAPVRFEVGEAPLGLAVSDLDGDGALDVAVSLGQSHAVAVLWNDRFGRLGSPTHVGLDGLLGELAAADVDGDGVTDLVVVVGAGAAVLKNYGGRRLALAGAVLRGNTQEATTRFAIGDLDGDHHPDLVLDEAIWLNRGGDATFPTSVTLPLHAPGEPLLADRLALGDLDGDGDLDLAATLRSPGVVVLLNQGGATFSGPTVYTPSGVARTESLRLAIADLDGDDRLDVVTAQPAILRNLGGGQLAPPVDLHVRPRGEAPGAVVAADVTGDGRPELLLTPRDIHDVLVVLATPKGLLEDVVELPSDDLPEGPFFTSVLDLDRDALPDVVLGDARGLYPFHNLGGRKLEAAGTVPSPNLGGAATGDLDGDKHADLVLLAWDGVVVWYAHGDGKLTQGPRVALPMPPRDAASAAIGDLDGDGDADLLVTTNSGTMVIEQTAPGVFAPAGPRRGSTLAAEVLGAPTLVDLDHDGRLDLAATQGGDVVTLRQVQGGVFPEVVPHQLEGVGWIGADDLDGDGYPDLVGSSLDKVSVLRNLHDGTLGKAGSLDGSGALGVVLLRDFSGDGRPDLVLDDIVSQYLVNDGAGAFALRSVQASVQGSPVAAADLDADGRNDLVVGSMLLFNRCR